MGIRFLNEIYHILLLLLPFATEFNYDNPNQWVTEFPQCGGHFQSPIAISKSKSTPLKAKPMLFGLYEEYLSEPFTIRNNGHTVEFSVPVTTTRSKPFITSGPLKEVYVAESVHYHWGAPGKKGSEHKVNGRYYDLEMHIVHRNSKYESVEEARTRPDGLVVVALLFKAIKEDVYFPGLSEVFDSIPRVKQFNSITTTRNRLSLGSLMANAKCDEYFTYPGSLTTPPCYESVTWIVLSTIVPISVRQLSNFHELLDNHNRKLRNNVRPIQPLNNRPVFFHKADVNYVLYTQKWF